MQACAFILDISLLLLIHTSGLFKSRKVWKMSKFMGESDHSLRAEVILVATTKEKKPWVRPPISMQFQVNDMDHCHALQRSSFAGLALCSF
jgi:hypothetical protein